MRKVWLKKSKDKRAEMGVGTMIIFIAMILVAAVAASVLISTANQVREQAQSTGHDAIGNVASGIVVQDVTGTVDTNAITQIDINVRLAAGSPDIDMNNVVVSISNGASVVDMKLANASAAGAYTAAAVRDASNDFDTTHYLHQGDLIKITIGSAAPVSLAPQTHVILKIMPAYGQANEIQFTTPETYTGTVIALK